MFGEKVYETELIARNIDDFKYMLDVACEEIEFTPTKDEYRWAVEKFKGSQIYKIRLRLRSMIILRNRLKNRKNYEKRTSFH